MKISIAMATYNGALYIREQLQSFVDQTRQPDELIITDDCSTDDTEIIVREFAKTAPFPVEFYRNERNLGYCGNFNAALMKTTGDVVFLSDQDDVWFPEKIQYVLNIAAQNPNALVVMNDAALTDGELNEVRLTKIGQIRSAGLPMDSFVMGCCCMVRRELLTISLPIPDNFKAHDYWLVRIGQELGGKVVDRCVLQYYRRHGSNESQFVANRLDSVSKVDVFKLRFVKLFDRKGRARLAEERERLEALRAAFDRAIFQGWAGRRSELKNAHVNISKELRIIEFREHNLDNNRMARVLALLGMIALGRLGKTGRLRALVHDFFA